MQFKPLSLPIVVLFIVSHAAFAQGHTYFTHGGVVRALAYSPVNAAVVASAGDSTAIKVWHLQNDTVTTLSGHTDRVNSIAFSPDGQHLLSGSDDYTFKVWDVSRGQEIKRLQHITDNFQSQVKAVTFSSNGQQVATAGKHVKLWDTRDWREVTTLRHDNWVWTVTFSPDGRLLAAGDGSGSVSIWDVQQRGIIKMLEADTNAVYTVAFSPDNQTLASGGYDGESVLWRRSDWKRLGTLAAHGTTFTGVFSPDSSTLACTGYESVTLWAVDSGEKIATLTGHTGWVRAAAFSPDGATLATGGEDGTFRLWDVTSYSAVHQDMVRIIYFVPRERAVQSDMWTKLDTLIRDTQQFYAAQMDIHKFGRKTFTFETDENDDTLFWRVDGQFRDGYYHTDTTNKVLAEVAEQFDMSKHIYLIVVDISPESIGHPDTCGMGGGNWFGKETWTKAHGGYAVIPASGQCFDGETGISVTAHELGHAFGLEHDFRNDAYIMSYGAAPERFSKCAAEWLDVSRYFNANETAFNEPTMLQLLSLPTYPPNAKNLRLQFEITDADGLRQAQLLIPTTAEDPAPGTKLHSCKRLDGQSHIVEFVATELTARRVNDITLQVIDGNGHITRRNYTLSADDSLLVQNPLDVDSDGTVTVADLVLVASSFGEAIAGTASPNPDVNRDGVVNITDLILVANEISSGTLAAPARLDAIAARNITALQQWLTEAKQLRNKGANVEKGIAVLEHLLKTLMPAETRLLANYPNPFNPETWIPYQLSEPADVKVYIYAANGALVRALALGYQPAGTYRAQHRAAYWDGKNALGEKVASGIYFCTLSAGDFMATQKMLIQK